MGVRDAVEKVEQHVANAPAKVSPAHMAKAAVEHQKEMLAAILPTGADPEREAKRYAGMALQAIKKTPDLLGCFATTEGEASFIIALNQAAIAKLEPNTVTEDCWILPRKVRFKDRGAWVERQEAELQVSYKGYIKLGLRSPRVADVRAAAVYEADEFEHYHALPKDVFRHRQAPVPRSERGPITHAWCIVDYVTGGYHLLVFDREQIDKRRDKSESWLADERRRQRDPAAKLFSPWNVWEEEMVVKTVIRASRAYMDLTPSDEAATAADGARLGWDDQRQQITHQPFDGPAVGSGLGGEGEPIDVPALDAGSEDAPSDAEPPPSVPDDGPAPRPPTQRQLTKLNILLDEKLDLRGDDRLTWLSEHLRPIRSTKDLTFDEAHDLIERLEAIVVEQHTKTDPTTEER